MAQEKMHEFLDNETKKTYEVYREIRTDGKTRDIIVPKVGEWGGKDGAERLRALIDASKIKAGLPV